MRSNYQEFLCPGRLDCMEGLNARTSHAASGEPDGSEFLGDLGPAELFS